MFTKLSFRQLLLGVFLLIALLLSATSVHALLTLDRLAAHSREIGRDAVILTANAQRLAERSVAMCGQQFCACLQISRCTAIRSCRR